MTGERAPAVAGLFYPDRPDELEGLVRGYLDAVPETPLVPKALIAPHAGYPYSGPVAASAYRLLEPCRTGIHRVVLLGPAHRVGLRGLGAPSVGAYRTPLGSVPIDTAALGEALEHPAVSVSDAAHAPEHSLEVHLPFLQVVLDAFRLVPLVVGDATADEVAEVLERLWGGPETLVVISTDLSHYHDYETARQKDLATCAAIESLDGRTLDGHRACGYVGVAGLLEVARRRHLEITRLDVRNSGDTAGPRDQVVGYGSWALSEPDRAA